MPDTNFRQHVARAADADPAGVVELIRRYSRPGWPPHIDHIDRPGDFLYAMSGQTFEHGMHADASVTLLNQRIATVGVGLQCVS